MRLGLFGGTFDPPHLGHLALASAAYQQLRLASVLWILTGVQPLKLGQHITPVEHRLAMLERILGDDPRFAVSRVEVERPGPHFSVDTLRILAGQYPNADLVFLIGGDSLRDLPRWRLPSSLVSACAEIGVMRRPGDTVDLPALEAKIPGLTQKLRFMDAPLVDISASRIRQQAAAGEDISQFLTPQVHNYIQEHNLYK